MVCVSESGNCSIMSSHKLSSTSLLIESFLPAYKNITRLYAEVWYTNIWNPLNDTLKRIQIIQNSAHSALRENISSKDKFSTKHKIGNQECVIFRSSLVHVTKVKHAQITEKYNKAL